MRHIRLLVFASNAIFPTIFNVKSAAQATGRPVRQQLRYTCLHQDALGIYMWESTDQGERM